MVRRDVHVSCMLSSWPNMSFFLFFHRFQAFPNLFQAWAATFQPSFAPPPASFQSRQNAAGTNSYRPVDSTNLDLMSLIPATFLQIIFFHTQIWRVFKLINNWRPFKKIEKWNFLKKVTLIKEKISISLNRQNSITKRWSVQYNFIQGMKETRWALCSRPHAKINPR